MYNFLTIKARSFLTKSKTMILSSELLRNSKFILLNNRVLFKIYFKLLAE